MTKSDACRTILGVELTSSQSALVTEIESHYANPIRARLGTKYGVGGSGFDDDGTPYVELNHAVMKFGIRRRQSAVLHELFHLKFRVDGHGGVIFEFANRSARDNSGGFFLEMVSLVRDPIEHTLIFPRMRSLGCDPTIELRSFAERVVKGALPPPIDPDQRSVFYMRVLLEVDDPKVLAAVRAWYRSNGWQDDEKRGERMARIVWNDSPQTPTAIAETFVRVLNSLLNGRADLDFRGWAEEVKGPVTVPVARIGVTM